MFTPVAGAFKFCHKLFLSTNTNLLYLIYRQPNCYLNGAATQLTSPIDSPMPVPVQSSIEKGEKVLSEKIF